MLFTLKLRAVHEMLRKFLVEHGMPRKDFFIVFILTFNALTWWYILPLNLEEILNTLTVTSTQTLIVWTTYFTTIVISGIVGSILAKKVRRLILLYLWISLGAIVTLIPVFLNTFSLMQVLILSILFGGSFGLGMPSCLSYFADWTSVENRGRIGGILLFFVNLCAPLLAISFELSFSMFSLAINSIILAVWRAFGLIVFFLKPREKLAAEDKKKIPSFSSIIKDRIFVLYFVAWLMFCFIDRFETPIQKHFLGDSYDTLLLFAPLLGSLSALVGGILADRFGRKRILLYGFVTLGLAYAIIGITSMPEVSWYLSLGVLFISAGMVWVIFIAVLWGDLAKFVTSEKLYALGTIPFFLTNIVQLFSSEYFTEIPVTSAFSLAAFFLFLAVLPLWYAPETLPEKKMELRRLRSFAEDAKKAKEKYERKMKG